MSNNKVGVGDSWGLGNVKRRRQRSEQVGVCGQWLFRAWRPVAFSDPQKALALFRDNGIKPGPDHAQRILDGRLWFHAFRRLMGFLSQAHANHVYNVIDRLVLPASGELFWRSAIDNVVVDEGLTNIAEQRFNGSGFTAADFIGLTDGTPTVAPSDTMASHPGWVEVTAYSEVTRPQYTPTAAANKVVTNNTQEQTFSINANGTTVGGGFLSTDSTKGGATGTLISGDAFATGDSTFNDGDSFDVRLSYTFSSV